MKHSGLVITTICATLVLSACGKQQQQDEEPSATEPAASLSAPAPAPATEATLPVPAPAAKVAPEAAPKVVEEKAAVEEAAAPKAASAQEEIKAAVKPAPAEQKPAAEQVAAAVPGKKTGDSTAALALAQKSGCLACHNVDKKIVGPAWRDVAARYQGDAGAKDKLIAKVKTGGKGNWTEITGGMAMPPYSPRVSDADIEKLVTFVLSLR